MLYLSYQKIEAEVNDASFTNAQIPSTLIQLKKLLNDAQMIDQRFINLNKNTLYADELKEENDLRDSKINLVYQRLQKKECNIIFCNQLLFMALRLCHSLVRIILFSKAILGFCGNDLAMSMR